MSVIKRPGFVYIGRRELQHHGHYVSYALGVEAQHQEVWLQHQRKTFPNTEIFTADDWTNNGTVLAYYSGPPPGTALDTYQR